MLLTSTWRVTLAGVVLLDYGDYMSAEPSITPSGIVQQRVAVRATYASDIARGGRRNVVEFGRIKICADDEAARDYLLSHLSVLPLCSTEGLLEITDESGTTTSLANAILTSAGRPRTENDRFLAEYTITGGELATDADGTGEGGDGGDPFYIPTEPLNLIDPLVVPTGRSATIPAGRVCFAYSTSIVGSLTVDPAGLLQLVPAA